MIALPAFTLGLQPAMVPSSVAKMKMLAPDMPFWETLNPAESLLKTSPVGVPSVPGLLPAGGGIVTGGKAVVPSPL